MSTEQKSHNIYDKVQNDIEQSIKGLIDAGKLNPTDGKVDFAKLTVEAPKDQSHGDMATNAAMVLCKQLGKNPRELAQTIAESIKGLNYIDSVEIAGPGFINLRFKKDFWLMQLSQILELGSEYGKMDLGKGEKVNVEFVSVNPTGPMHVGHSRGAIYGDSLANLLKNVGYDVTKEYYINDAGGQINTLARAAYQRYIEALGHEIGEIEGYSGEYLIPVGKALAEKYGDKFVGKDESEWLEIFKEFAAKEMMKTIKADLELIGIKHDVFTSEKSLTKAGKVEEALEKLDKLGLLYTGVLEAPKGKVIEDWEPRPQLLFKSTAFGDDVDRALKKSDGSWTYLTPDIAYHYDKYKRGFKKMIDILGADHGGYIKRITAATKAISEGEADVDVKTCQMVRFIKDGKEVKMSKRAGTFISIRDAVEKVGKDVLRFIMLTRKNDAQFDFDFEKVLEQSKDNPVFYVQYAHARGSSIKRNIKETFQGERAIDLDDKHLAKLDFKRAIDDDDIELLKVLAQYPKIIELAAKHKEPHRIAFYLYDVASAFHSLWNKGKEKANLRFVDEKDANVTAIRFALVRAMQTVLANGLDMLSITPVDEMQ